MKDADINFTIAKHLIEQLGEDAPPYHLTSGEALLYCIDLNIMHLVEEKLDSMATWVENGPSACAEEAYMGWLAFVIKGTASAFCDDWSLVHATARQRAEAFLRTIGKWKDE